MAVIMQTTLYMHLSEKTCAFWLKFQWVLFPVFKLAVRQHGLSHHTTECPYVIKMTQSTETFCHQASVS